MVSSYDRYTIAFHWLIALVIFVEYILVWIIPEGTRGPTALATYHESFGIVVILLMLARLIWRLFSQRPAPAQEMPRWQVVASKWTHYALYLFCIIVPLSGWLWISAQGWKVQLFYAIPLPHLIAQNASLGATLRDTHEFVASILLLIVSIHVVAALYHYFVVKDDVMQRMWP